jgi:hypothetical protein
MAGMTNSIGARAGRPSPRLAKPRENGHAPKHDGGERRIDPDRISSSGDAGIHQRGRCWLLATLASARTPSPFDAQQQSLINIVAEQVPAFDRSVVRLVVVERQLAQRLSQLNL